MQLRVNDMLADVLINESEDEISSRLARYEVRFSNRYTEKDDGYKTCVQKAARHNQVPVIDYDKRHTRRRGRRDGRMMGGKRGYPYNRPRYNYGDQGQPLRRQRDYTSSRLEDESGNSYLKRNASSYAPSSYDHHHPPPSYNEQQPPSYDHHHPPPPHGTDLATSRNTQEGAYPQGTAPPCELEDDGTRPHTPGSPDTHNTHSPLREDSGLADKVFNSPDHSKPDAVESVPDLHRFKQAPIIMDFPAPPQAPTEEDAMMILANVSKTKGINSLEKEKKTSKRRHENPEAKDKVITVPHSIHFPPVPAAQVLKSSYSGPLPHTTHQPSPFSSVGMHVTHGAPQSVHTSFMTREVVGTEDVIKRAKKKKKKKKKEKHRTSGRSDKSGEESGGSIDVTTVVETPHFETTSSPYVASAIPSASVSPSIVIHLSHVPRDGRPTKEKKRKKRKSPCPSD